MSDIETGTEHLLASVDDGVAVLTLTGRSVATRFRRRC